jgi:hypothetical protein
VTGRGKAGNQVCRQVLHAVVTGPVVDVGGAWSGSALLSCQGDKLHTVCIGERKHSPVVGRAKESPFLAVGVKQISMDGGPV